MEKPKSVAGVELTILIVDDEPAEVRRLESVLQQTGHQVLTALTGEHAFQLAKTHCPDLIIIDTELPDMEGLELFRRIRVDPTTRETAVMLANPKPTEEAVFRGFSLWSDFHWQRPLDATELIRVVNRLAESRPRSTRRFQDLDFGWAKEGQIMPCDSSHTS
jgi:DNA-binding response OmpR family regulator